MIEKVVWITLTIKKSDYLRALAKALPSWPRPPVIKIRGELDDKDDESLLAILAAIFWFSLA
jgi:hypothetical protein